MISNNAKTEKPHIIHQIITLTCKNIIQKLIYNNHFKGSNIEILSIEVPPRVVIITVELLTVVGLLKAEI